MFAWIKANLLTIGVLLTLGAAVFAIAYSLIRNRRKGCRSCGNGCAHCAMCELCHRKEQTQPRDP